MPRQYAPVRAKSDRGSDGKRAAGKVPALQHLERLAGNRAVSHLVQRVPEGQQPASVRVSPIPATAPRGQQAVRNAPPWRRSETSEGGARLPRALVWVGYALPRSARAAGD